MNACKIGKSEVSSISLLLIDAQEMAGIPILAFRGAKIFFESIEI